MLNYHTEGWASKPTTEARWLLVITTPLVEIHPQFDTGIKSKKYSLMRNYHTQVWASKPTTEARWLPVITTPLAKIHPQSTVWKW